VAVVAVAASIAGLGLAPVAAHAAGPRPLFQLPFPCGEQWSAHTYYGHDPIEKIDFLPESGVTEGRPVLADADGIAYSGGSPDSSGGYQVAIDHGNGWATLYLHLQAGSFTVPSTGRQVRQGERVARVGNTGTATSKAHLHYEQVQDAYVDSNGQLVYGTIVRAMFNGELATYTPEQPQTLTSRNCDHKGSSVSGDGRAELMVRRPDGQVWSWRNDKGWAGDTYQTNTRVAWTSPDETPLFADLDGDGRAELMVRKPDGQVWSWRNDRGWAGDTYQTNTRVAWTSPDETPIFG
jgi:hypothetical protein